MITISSTSTIALFENMVVAELVKHEFNAGHPAEFYFWRDSEGREVGLLVPREGRLQPVETNPGQPSAATGLHRYANYLPCRATKPCRRG